MITLLLFMLAGAFKAVSDSIAHGKIRFAGRWWATDSWKNKWQDGDPKKGEAFFLSSTVLVWASDAWHFFNMLTHACFAFAAVSYEGLFNGFFWWWVDAFILWGAMACVFEVCYKWVFSKTTQK